MAEEVLGKLLEYVGVWASLVCVFCWTNIEYAASMRP